MGVVLDLQFYLNRIPEQYHKYISFCEEFWGQNTKIKYTNPECGCVIETNLKQLASRKSFDSCPRCILKTLKPIEHYIEKIPQQYRQNVTIVGEYIGANTLINFKHNTCGCISKTKLSCLHNRDQFEYCKKCYFAFATDWMSKLSQDIKDRIICVNERHGLATTVKITMPECNHEVVRTLQSLIYGKSLFCPVCRANSKKHTKNIPKKYEKYIEFLDTTRNFNTPIRYTNPGCGCVSETTMGALRRRKQLDYCNRCETHNRTKSIKEYLARIPEQYRDNISYKVDNGYYSRITYTYPECGCTKSLNLNSLLINKRFDICYKCQGSEQRLSQEDMCNSFPFLNNVRIIGGYPGNRTTKISGICKACGKEVEHLYFNLQMYYKYYQKAQCPNCMPRNQSQHELYLFVKELGFKAHLDEKTIIKFDTNKHKHLDIYCQEKQFAIEYNGLIWHSEKYKQDTEYHWKKTKSCLDKGITLLHVWGDKYQVKKDVYKSIIKTKLGVIESKISARNTHIRELNKKELKEFFDNNHLDDYVSCITGWGLFYNNKLVQAISVRKVNNQNKKYKGYLEIARMSTLKDHLVVGGESKLLTKVEEYTKDRFKGILNYVSCDFGGVQKQKWKFRFDGITECSYCYTDGSRRISRQRLQKRKPGQTEKELAEELGLIRVNLTPNLVYVYEF